MNQNVRRANTKTCSLCKVTKHQNSKNWYRNSTCAACYQRRYKANFPERFRDTKLRHGYGLSLEEFNARLQKQEFKCAICKRASNSLKSGKVQNFVVDHCHRTKIVRGLLCHACNMRVGIVENWLKPIQKYLRSARSRG